MAQKKISELQSANTLTLSADLLPVVNEGATRKITVKELLEYVPEVYTDLQQLSGNWQNTSTVVQSNSASWAVDSTTDTGVRALSAAWQDTLTVVQANSASWAVDSTIDSGVRALSASWTDTLTVVQANSARWVLEDFIIACSDETTNLTTTASAITFRVPFAMYLNSIRASVNVAPAGSSVIVDVMQNGSSLFSTLLTIDANEKTSMTAAVPAVLSNQNLVDDAEMTVAVNQVGSTTPGKGLKVTFKGYRV